MGIPYAEVIGDPIAHSKSPTIHKFWLEKLGMDGDYRASRVTVDALHQYLVPKSADPDWRGCNVTMPLKRAILPYLGRLDHLAEKSGAANAVVLDKEGVRTGCNTDIPAIAECLGAAGLSQYPGRVATYVQIVGTGGAARAAAFGAIEAGYVNLDMEFYGRDVDAARTLAGVFASQPDFGGDLTEIGGFATERNAGQVQRYSNVLINASPLGMTGFPPLEVEIDTYHIDTVVLDLVYDPVETWLIREARARGMKTIDGLELLIAQAARAFELFFGAEAPRGHDAELRELLTR